MGAAKRIESNIVVILVGVLAAVALIWSDPSNRDLTMVGAFIFLSLFFIKPEKLLLVYLVICPLLDQMISFMGGQAGPQIILRGGIVLVLLFYWLTAMRNPLNIKVARPMMLLLFLLGVSALVFAGGQYFKTELAALAKLALWMLLLLTVADMVTVGKMKVKWIYRCVTLSLLITVLSLSRSEEHTSELQSH